MRPAYAQHCASSCYARLHTARRILDHKAVLGSGVNQLRPAAIRLRVRLPALHHITADHEFRHWQASRLQPADKQSPRCGAYNCPPPIRQALQQLPRSGKNLKVCQILKLHVLDEPQTLNHIYTRHQRLHNVDRAHTMGHFIAVRIWDAIVLRPTPPAPGHAGNRTDQHSIHVEQNAFHLKNQSGTQLSRPAITNARAASSIACTLSLLQLSQYTRNSGSVPLARSNSHVSAAFGFAAHTGSWRKNLIPSSVSVRSTVRPPNSVSPEPARRMAASFSLSVICMSIRP